jgi:hypothetical protein
MALIWIVLLLLSQPFLYTIAVKIGGFFSFALKFERISTIGLAKNIQYCTVL